MPPCSGLYPVAFNLPCMASCKDLDHDCFVYLFAAQYTNQRRVEGAISCAIFTTVCDRDCWRRTKLRWRDEIRSPGLFCPSEPLFCLLLNSSSSFNFFFFSFSSQFQRRTSLVWTGSGSPSRTGPRSRSPSSKLPRGVKFTCWTWSRWTLFFTACLGRCWPAFSRVVNCSNSVSLVCYIKRRFFFWQHIPMTYSWTIKNFWRTL